MDSSVKLSIPAGSQSGDKLRIKGKGIADVNSGRKGDIYVVLNVVVPKKLSREQKKLFEKLADTGLDEAPEFDRIKRYVK